MSSFTQFDGEEHLVYQRSLSIINDKDLWMIRPGYRYYIGHKGSDRWVDVEDGFITDGATIPRVLWWLLPPIGEYTQATSLHDKLCTTYEITCLVDGIQIQIPVTRKEIDEILEEALLVLKVKPWKIRTIMLGVNLYRKVFNPSKPKPAYLNFS